MEKFFTPVQFCYDTVCSEVLVPWVLEFEELISRDTNVAILKADSGEFKPGLYVRLSGYWQLALNYQDLCTLISKGATFQIVVGVTTDIAVPGTSYVFRNGFLVPGATALTSGNMVWTVTNTVGAGANTIVQLTDLFGTPIGNFLVA